MTNKQSLFIAFELGYKFHEKGYNFQKAQEEFNKILDDKSQEYWEKKNIDETIPENMK